MKNSISCITNSNNIYTLNREKKYLYLTHPALLHYLYNECNGDQSYYAQKARYFKEHGFLKGYNHHFEGKITPSIVKNGIDNLRQIIFEVTDDCNLKCKYCAYGEFYSDYDKRDAKKMTFETTKSMIDFIRNEWKGSKQKYTQQRLFFSFYGGEPLLNVPLIKKTIDYIESLSWKNNIIEYSMTSNAMLLDKHMDFLAEKKFHLLISLDGNKHNNGYRVNKNGDSVFDRVVKNIHLLKEKHPKYFKEYVNFNSVLHDKNSTEEIVKFFNDEFGKTPRIASLSNTGILPEKRKQFNEMFKDYYQDIKNSKNHNYLNKKMSLNSPEYYNLSLFMSQYSKNSYDSYNELFIHPKDLNYIPTGTCSPFSRKIFITVNGKILTCERIGQQYELGNVNSKGDIDFSYEKIAKKYNKYFEKLYQQCNTCYQSLSCSQCMFTIDDLDSGEEVKCPSYTNVDTFAKYLEINLSFIEEHPDFYEKFKNVILA